MIKENCNKKKLKHILYRVAPAKELGIILASDKTHHQEIKIVMTMSIVMHIGNGGN